MRNGDDLLWKRILRSVHNLPNRFLSLSDFQQVHNGPFSDLFKASQSFPWLDRVIKDYVQLKLGKGSTIRFWEDHRIDTAPIQHTFPRLYSISQQQSFTVSDMGVWDGEKTGNGTSHGGDLCTSGRKISLANFWLS